MRVSLVDPAVDSTAPEVDNIVVPRNAATASPVAIPSAISFFMFFLLEVISFLLPPSL
jgi:hypothetical protein